MNKVSENICKALIVLAILDIVIVLGSMVAIAQGEAVQHVPFWDAQMRFVIHLLT